MHHIRPRVLTLMVTASLLLWASIVGTPATAAPVPLPTSLGDLLVPDAFFIQGDKRFDNFSTNASLDPNFPVTIEGITVSGQHGFVASYNTSDELGETFTSVTDFKVTVLDPGFNLHGVTITDTFTGTLGSGASLTIESKFFSDEGHTVSLGNLTTGTGFPSPGARTFSQDVRELFVQLNNTEVGSLSGTNRVQFIFTQDLSHVPVPPAALLFGSGLLAVVSLWYRWRKTA